MTVCHMTRSKAKVTRLLLFEFRSFSKPLDSAICSGSRQITSYNDTDTMEQYLNLITVQVVILCNTYYQCIGYPAFFLHCLLWCYYEKYYAVCVFAALLICAIEDNEMFNINSSFIHMTSMFSLAVK